MRHFFGLMIGLLVATTLQAAPLKLWISSHQDKIYYEKMAGLYRQTVDAGFEAEIQAFGFREMPDKLGTAIKTGEGVPDIVQLDEIFFGMYLSDQIPFADLTERVQQSGLDRDLLRQRVDLLSAKAKYFASNAACEAADRAVQVLGGRGYSELFRPGRHWKDVRVCRIYEGTDEILKLKIAAGVLGKEYEAYS